MRRDLGAVLLGIDRVLPAVLLTFLDEVLDVVDLFLCRL
jgi:hypothetical protein